MLYKDISKGLIILLSLAVVSALTVNFFSAGGIALFGDWDISQGVITPKSKDDVVDHELEIQSVLMAKEIYDIGKAVFVDCRVQEQYEDGHIKAAFSLPIDQFDECIDEFMREYPTSTLIVTYCSGRECDDSHKLAQHLFDEGYPDVMVFVDGYPGWVEQGYPIE